MTFRFSRGVVVAAVVAAGACGHPSVGPRVTPLPAPAPSRPLPNDIVWFRRSAEYRALARQAYRAASDRLPELSRGLDAKSWAVIMDADETMLDNSEYQRRRFVLDSAYTDAS